MPRQIQDVALRSGIARQITEITLSDEHRKLFKECVAAHGTPKHAKVRARLENHPRFHRHFIPTSSSWLNLVERWFAELTNKAVRRGSFQSVPNLIEKIGQFIESHNLTRQNPSMNMARNKRSYRVEVLPFHTSKDSCDPKASPRLLRPLRGS